MPDKLDIHACPTCGHPCIVVSTKKRGGSLQDILNNCREMELDNDPDGWPAIEMRDVTALCDAIEKDRFNHYAPIGWEEEREKLREACCMALGLITVANNPHEDDLTKSHTAKILLTALNY